MSYRDVLALKGLKPIKIERTMKRAGDLVLRRSVGAAEVVPGVRGRFAGRNV